MPVNSLQSCQFYRPLERRSGERFIGKKHKQWAGAKSFGLIRKKYKLHYKKHATLHVSLNSDYPSSGSNVISG